MSYLKQSIFKTAVFISCLFFALTLQAQTPKAPPTSFNFQGRLLNSSNVPIEAASVTFTVQIRSHDSACLLREEKFTKDMTSSGGVFSLQVGAGTVDPLIDPGFSLLQDF